jgi:hypothetical protein
MTDIFISYSRKDISFARVIYLALQQMGLDIWIDWERIPVGDDWWKNNFEAIDKSKVFIFLVSKHTIESIICKNEVNRALYNKKRIIPILLGDLQPLIINKFVPELSNYNWITVKEEELFTFYEAVNNSTNISIEKNLITEKVRHFIENLNVDIHANWEWVKIRNEIFLKAECWEKSEHNKDFLLHDLEYEFFRREVLCNSSSDLELTDLMKKFILESEEHYLKSSSSWYKTEGDRIDLKCICRRCGNESSYTPALQDVPPNECPSCGFSPLSMSD